MSADRRTPPRGDVASTDFELIFRSLPGAYIVLSVDFTVLAVSDELIAATRTKRADLIGRYIFDALPVDPLNPGAFVGWLASLEKVLATRAPDAMPTVKYSVPRLESEGAGFTEKYWRPENYPVLGPDGEVRYIIHRTEEISELRQMHERLITQASALEAEARIARRAEQQVVDVLESMSDAFFSVDKDWKITRLNAQHEKLTKYKREEQLGKSLLELFFPMPEAKLSKYWISYHKAMNERVPVQFEEYYPPFDLWTQVRTYPTSDGGLAVFFTDTTAQKKISQRIDAERQKFEAIFFDSPASMALLRGPELIFEKVNAQYRALIGQRDVIGKSFAEGLPDLAGQPYHSLIQRVFATGESFAAAGMPARLIQRPGGEPEDGYFDVAFTRVEDGSGQPYGVYLHAHNVTERVRSRQRIEQLATRLQEAVSARDEFLSIASHELKTPLTSLKMQLQQIRRGVKVDEGVTPPAEKIARALDLSNRQLSRLTALIEDLLDVSRLQSGRMSYDFEAVDLGALVGEVVERFREQLDAAGCALTVSLAKNVTIVCDRFRIEQVVTNLITNAIKYGAGTPVKIQVASSAAGATISVSDKGMGIAKEKHAQIFNRFERAISPRNISGLGLGLYISKQIVDAHGGTIRVDSEPGQGSTFTVELLAEAAAPSPRAH